MSDISYIEFLEIKKTKRRSLFPIFREGGFSSISNEFNDIYRNGKVFKFKFIKKMVGFLNLSQLALLY